MIRMLLALALTLFSFLPVLAEAPTAADRSAIKSVIMGQLDAFATDDPATAYGFAAPIVKGAFPNIDQFMAMVKGGYKPVYRNTARSYGDVFTDNMGRPAMRVVLTAEDGKRWEAIYAMQQQPDGNWKIAGCVLLALAGQEV